VNPQEIEDLLKKVKYPGFSRDIVSFGIVRDIIFDGPKPVIRLEFSTKDTSIAEQVARDIGAVLSEAGVEDADIQVKHTDPQQAGHQEEPLLPGVKHVIAVASGKGGVGKSTVAANLAIALARAGHKTGLLDADIYGPSVQMLLGLDEEPQTVEGEKKLQPMEAHGIKAMSMGVLVDSSTALVWRGPMVSSAVEQLMRDVKWGDLDILVIDMPPGTGDIQLTVAQKIKLDGSVIVTTPQELALMDARKGISMFQKVEIPVLGLVENMSYFICSHCGEKTNIFANGGARKEALKMKVPFLGEIPLVPEIRQGGDEGHPVATTEGPIADAFKTIAESVWKGLEVRKTGVN